MGKFIVNAIKIRKGYCDMYMKFGFVDNGIANSSWGGEEWYELNCTIGWK